MAAFESDCAFLDCDFDSSASSDSDGTIAGRAWTFGDGGTSNAANPSHVYDLAGTYDVTLTVTDDDGASDVVTHQVTVEAAPPTGEITHVASAVGTSSTATPSVTIPASVQSGDRLVLVLSMNDTTRTFTNPAGVTGWTKLDTNVAKTMSTTVWTKTATAGNSGASVSVPLTGGAAKSTLTVAAYDGVDADVTPSFAAASSITNVTTRSTPLVTAPAGSWVLSYWADKSSTTTAWTTAAPVASRQAACAASSGRICSLLADSNAGVSGGYGNVAASTNAPSSSATMWSIVLTPDQ